MRKFTRNFNETAYLSEKNKNYEHRENYSMGAGYYLGENKYHGWIISKEFYSRENIINNFALPAYDEINIQIGAADKQPVSRINCEGITIIDYSEKAIAVTDDTKPINISKRSLPILAIPINSVFLGMIY